MVNNLNKIPPVNQLNKENYTPVLTQIVFCPKKGFTGALGEILTASSDNIKKEIKKRVVEIRSGECLSPKRIDQISNVKTIFRQAKLAQKACEIDRLIDTAKRPTVGLKNGVDYPKRAY